MSNQNAQNNFKNDLTEKQKKAGLVQYQLASVLEELLALAADKDKEPKHWQAVYDYVCARLSSRIAYIYEYNAMLGQMRKEYPPYEKDRHSGWRLASRERFTDRDAEKDAKKARDILTKMAKEHAGTPWELVAKREKITALGLEWQPMLKNN